MMYCNSADASVVYVTDVATQEAVCQQLCRSRVLVVGTEGVEAQLIQLLVPSTTGRVVYLLHNLPITRSLHRLLTAPSTLKVMFGPHQNQRTLSRRMGSEAMPVLDMQVVLVPFSGFSSLGAAAQQLGVGSKQQWVRGFADTVDWEARLRHRMELTDSLTGRVVEEDGRWEYAVNDVLLIHALYKRCMPSVPVQDMPVELLPSINQANAALIASVRNCKTEQMAVAYLLHSSRLFKENDDASAHKAAVQLARMYWAKPVVGPRPSTQGEGEQSESESESQTGSIMRAAQESEWQSEDQGEEQETDEEAYESEVEVRSESWSDEEEEQQQSEGCTEHCSHAQSEMGHEAGGTNEELGSEPECEESTKPVIQSLVTPKPKQSGPYASAVAVILDRKCRRGLRYNNMTTLHRAAFNEWSDMLRGKVHDSANAVWLCSFATQVFNKQMLPACMCRCAS